jgi:transcription-repair coupling factor (superfamily II helicase)
LRGRVGRSNRRAYAYLLIPADVELTPIARRRLAALKEFSDLGAGFKIAALDLELRGAGNLLGGEQSGHIEAIGFDLYTQMLEQAVREIKGEAEPQPQTQLNLGLNIRIPFNYVPEENQRLRLYKKIAGIETERQLADAESELRDRYGEPPAPVRQLLQYAALHLQAVQVGVTNVERKRDLVTIKFREDAPIDPGKLAAFVSSQRGAQVLPDGMLKFSAKALGAQELLEQIQSLLSHLAESVSPSVV